MVALIAHHTPTVTSFSHTVDLLGKPLTWKFTSQLNWSQDSLSNRTSVEYLSPLCTPWQDQYAQFSHVHDLRHRDYESQLTYVEQTTHVFSVSFLTV